MFKRYALAVVCLWSLGSTVASAHGPTLNRANIATNRGLGAHLEVAPIGRQTSVQPTTVAPVAPVKTRKGDATAVPAPAATPEWNPLRRRRMAMPGSMPGPDPDFAF